jgi:hypothetical protein
VTKEVSLDRPGKDASVEGVPPVRFWGNWAVTQAGIYFVPADAVHSLRYFDFATKQIRPVFEVQKDFSAGFSVSPDGRWMLYSQLDEENSDLMLVEHFR